MTIALYIDEHIPRAITAGLRLRGVDVLIQEDERADFYMMRLPWLEKRGRHYKKWLEDCIKIAISYDTVSSLFFVIALV